ncbi:hypothetical protein AHAS_Ahas20G0100900 [Arachis hypogaea]
MKYQDGLRDDIMQAVAPLEIKSFSELVNKSCVVEDCSKRIETPGTNRGDYHNQERARSFALRGQKFKREGYNQQPQQAQNSFRRKNNNNNH